jgi:hypothetical protein
VHRTVTLRAQIAAGLVAGLVAGAVMELFLFLTLLPGGDPVRASAANLVFISTVLLGPSAATNPVAVPLGIVLHFCVAVGWALGYVYLVRSQPQLVRHPWISGACFGIVVYVFMQIVLLTAGQYHRPSSATQLEIALVSHIVFYGIPVALIVSRMLRGAGTATG